MSVILDDIMLDIIKNYAQKWGFSKSKIQVKTASKNGDSFSGDVFRIILTQNEQELIKQHQENCIITRTTLNPKVFKIIIKVAPKNELRRQLFNSSAHFIREKYVYENVLPAMIEFQKKYLCKMDLFKNYPTLIAAESNTFNEYIMLNDLVSIGFKNFDRPKPLNFERCKLVMINLAKLHSISFAMKKQNKIKFNELKENLKEIIFVEPVNEFFNDFLHKKIINALTTLDKNDQNDIIVRNKLKEFGKYYGKYMIDCVNSTTNQEDNVICHGDLWISNLMFRKINENQSEEICFLDWQVSRYCSPVIDLSYFIFCCTDSLLRKKLPELLEIYHKNLINRINELGCDGNKIFPYTKLTLHMKQYAKFGLGMALMTLHSTTCDSTEIPDVDKALDNFDFSNLDESCHHLIKKPAYKKRMSEVCRDMVKFGYL